MKKRRLFLAVLVLQLLSGCASIHRTKTVVWNYPYDDVVKHFYIGDSMDQAPDTMVVYGEVPAFDIKLYYSSDQDYLYQLTDNFLRNNDYKLISSSIKDGEDDKKIIRITFEVRSIPEGTLEGNYQACQASSIATCDLLE